MNSFYLGMKKIYSDFNKESAEFYLKNGWEEHNNSIKRLVSYSIDNLPNQSSSKAIILGAGNCSDIPINLICYKLKEVYLVDIDKKAITRAWNSFSTDYRKKIKLIEEDISGFNQSLMPTFFNLISAKKYVKAINLLNSNRWQGNPYLPNIGNKKFELVVSSCLLSQMASVWLEIFKAMVKITDIYYQRIHDLLCAFCNNVLLPNHLELLNRICAPNGKIVLVTDTLIWGYEGNKASPINQFIKDPKDITINTLLNRDIINYRLIGTFPVEIFVNKYFYVEQTDSWLWHFNLSERAKIYFVLGFVCNPK